MFTLALQKSRVLQIQGVKGAAVKRKGVKDLIHQILDPWNPWTLFSN